MIAVFLLYSCSKDEKSGPAPVLPSFSAMDIDFSIFSNKKDGSIKVSNWQYSVLSVARWNYLMNKVCAIPVTAFQKASDQKPSYSGDNKWQWNYKVATDSLIINARLVAQVGSDSLQWKLYISTTKEEITKEEFLWLYGTSASNQEKGWWIFYESAECPNPFIKIDWTNEKVNTYTYIKPNDSSAGSYLITGTLSNSDYDAYYTVYGKIHADFTNIEYSKATKAGRIKSPVVYGDDNWHYWDSTLANIE
jgi:hypothetical protein